MKKNTIKFISLMLVILTLFSAVSCDRSIPKEEYDEKRRLEITEDAPTYSEEFIERAANSFADIAEAFVLLTKNVALTDKQKTDFKNYFKIEVFPIIVMVRIYSDEVDGLFSAVLEYLSADALLRGGFETLATLYKKTVEALDSTRAGLLAFEFSKIMVSKKARECRQRYEKYGYSWYLEDAVRYENLEKGINETLGKDKFVAATGAVFFILSSIYGIGMPKNELGLSVNDKEMALILEMQADFFLEADISVGDWKIFAELLTELVPENNSSYINAELYALKKDGYFVRAIEVMPLALVLYEAVTDSLSKAKEPLRKEDGSLDISLILKAVLDSENELCALLDKIDASAATATKAENDAQASLNLSEAYGSFMSERSPISSDALVSRLRQLSSSDAVEADTLYGLICDYAVGIAPYLTFAAMYGS